VSASESLTIVIADDHAIVRQGLRLLLDAEQELSIVSPRWRWRSPPPERLSP
jgi:hypothetical protein